MPAAGDDHKFTVFGAVDYSSGQVVWQMHARKDETAFMAFLDHLAAALPANEPAVLVLDNASYHKSHALRAHWQRLSERFQPFFLPAYAPQLNLIERIWRYLKQKLACPRWWNDLTGSSKRPRRSSPTWKSTSMPTTAAQPSDQPTTYVIPLSASFLKCGPVLADPWDCKEVVAMTLHMRALTDEERTKLERIVHAQTAPVRLARRVRIVQLAAAGVTAPAIAVQVQQSEKCVRRWIARFNAAGLEGLDDAPVRDARVPIPRTPTVA